MMRLPANAGAGVHARAIIAIVQAAESNFLINVLLFARLARNSHYMRSPAFSLHNPARVRRRYYRAVAVRSGQRRSNIGTLIPGWLADGRLA
jgi:hypothetical protein